MSSTGHIVRGERKGRRVFAIDVHDYTEESPCSSDKPRRFSLIRARSAYVHMVLEGCDNMAIFRVSRDGSEEQLTIPGLACVECDMPILKGEIYAGKGGNATHGACRMWPEGTDFKVAGSKGGV